MMETIEEKRSRAKAVLERGGISNRIIPLSQTQIRSWEYIKNSPRSPFFNQCFQIHFKGAVNQDLLQRAIRRLVIEQEALRVRIIESERGPLQFLASPDDYVMAVIDLSMLSADKQAEKIKAIITETTETPFVLGEDPLFATKLLVLDREESILVFRSFQLVCDGMSIYFVIKSFFNAYQLLATDPNPPAAKGPNYLDYIEKQLELSQNSLQSELEYWKKELHEAPRQLPCPASQPNSKPAPKFPIQSFQIAGDDFKKIQAFLRAKGLTAYALFFAAFNLALYRWTGHPDFVVRSIMNNRTILDEKNWEIVGDFTNPYAFRAKINAAWTLQELLDHTKEKIFDAHSNSLVIYKKVLESLTPPSTFEQFSNVCLIMNNLEGAVELKFNEKLKGYPSMNLPGVGNEHPTLQFIGMMMTFPDFYLFQFEYNTKFRQQDEIKSFYASFMELVHLFIDRPEKLVSSIETGVQL